MLSKYLERYKKTIKYNENLCDLKCELKKGSLCMLTCQILEGWTIQPNGLGTFTRQCHKFTNQGRIYESR